MLRKFYSFNCPPPLHFILANFYHKPLPLEFLKMFGISLTIPVSILEIHVFPSSSNFNVDILKLYKEALVFSLPP